MLSICQWIHETPLSIAIRESIWVYPILNVLHCVGIFLVAGTIVVVDLRLLGFGMRRSSISSVISQVLPWTLGRFWVHVHHRIAARLVGAASGCIAASSSRGNFFSSRWQVSTRSFFITVFIAASALGTRLRSRPPARVWPARCPSYAGSASSLPDARVGYETT